MTPHPDSVIVPVTRAPASVFFAKWRRSRGRLSFWLWAVAAPVGALLIVTHHWWTI
jgi:hypothetical protein